ncbi:DUF305 domain-containing protein [soil metagenome]
MFSGTSSTPLRLLAACLIAGGALGFSSALAQDTTRTVRPGAPGEISRTVDASTFTHTQLPFVEADVRFMQHMIEHHAQALVMSRMAPARTQSPDVLLIARRIELSQEDEIAIMEQWLTTRRQPVPAVILDHPEPDPHRRPDAHHDHHAHHNHDAHADHRGHTDRDAHSAHHDMPGMLTDQQLAQLAAASGRAFDRLFLEFMIFHHDGARTMVEELFATHGAGQETEIFGFASHVESDQAIEIQRMSRMLAALHHH